MRRRRQPTRSMSWNLLHSLHLTRKGILVSVLVLHIQRLRLQLARNMLCQRLNIRKILRRQKKRYYPSQAHYIQKPAVVGNVPPGARVWNPEE